jgi:hypothetical protein
MNANLLYLDESELPNNHLFGENELIRDLKLDIVLDAMADQDSFLRNLCKKLLLHPSINKTEILMRQEVMKEALKLNDFFSSVYKISFEAMEKTTIYKELTQPKFDKIVSVLKRVSTHVELADLYIIFLEQLRDTIFHGQSSVSSPLLMSFCSEILQKYSIDYIQGVKSILKELSCLKIDSELILGCHPGTGLKSTDIKLHSISDPQSSYFRRKKSDAVILLDNILLINNSQEIIDSGLDWLLKTLQEFNQTCSLLFRQIGEMFGFYVGSITLYKKLSAKGISICFPSLDEENGFNLCDLQDIGLLLKNNTSVVGNTLSFSNKRRFIITI